MPTPPQSGWLVELEVAKVQVLLHWSFPFVGALLAAWIAWLASFSDRSLAVPYFLYASAWTLILVVIHELGHAAAGAAVGLKVEAIALAGTGGWCLCSRDTTPRRALLFYSGGLLAQAAAFLLAVALLYVYGAPRHPWLAAGAVVFTAGNALLFLGNAAPRGANDGALIRDAWRTLRASDA